MAGTNNSNFGTGSGGVGTCYVTLSVVANYDQQAATLYDVELFNANSPAQVQLITLNTGATTINSTNCPALTQSGGLIIVPPTGNANSIVLKGVSGDTGVTISPVNPSMFIFNSTPPTSIVITVSSTISGMRLIWV